jgi:hypothetical protein
MNTQSPKLLKEKLLGFLNTFTNTKYDKIVLALVELIHEKKGKKSHATVLFISKQV